jgi:Ca-activated chloride channel family protein
VLSDIAIDWGGINVSEIYPYPLPDLFAGSQLVIAGRYKGSGPATITLTGKVNSASQSYKFEDLNFAREGGDGASAFIAPLWATRKIGYLLAQIRLNGENKEAVDEIVSLAVRYGIVTPYTSFLIEEHNDVLTPEGRGGAAQDLHLQFAPMALPISGATAVQQAQANRALKEAEAPTQSSSALVKQVGDKAFIQRAGVWTDTQYDPAKMTPTRIQFGSESYFNLLSQHPEWGAYLALGERVLFVVDGVAYQVD